jgi:predicted transposase/invertase (TIGR01784 family)
MIKRINPFSDFGFKRIFGKVERKIFLIDFLNSLLKGERIITDLHYLDKEQVKQNVDDRSVIYDIFCEADNGDNFIVEMQNCYQPSFKNRSIFYLSRALAKQGKPGKDWDYAISAVYCISLLNHEALNMPRKFRTDVMLSDIDTGEVFSKKVKLVYLQLPYFDKREEECETNLEKWIFTLKHMEGLNQLPFTLDDDVFKILDEVTDVDSLTKEERREYDHALKIYRDYHGAMRGERELGAYQEHQQIIKAAGRMKSRGWTNEEIKEATSLSDEEINAL